MDAPRTHLPFLLQEHDPFMAAIPNAENHSLLDSTTSFECTSHITHVELYHQGAVVYRQVTCPKELPQGPLTLKVPQITHHAIPGSIKAKFTSKDSAREMVALRTVLHVEEIRQPGSELHAALEQLQLKIQAVNRHLQQITARYNVWCGFYPQPSHTRSWKEVGPLARVQAATSASRMAYEWVVELQEKRAALNLENEELMRQQERLLNEISNLSSQHQGDKPPTWQCLVECEGDGPVQMEISYIIENASWWPTYKLRLEDDAKRALLTVDAMVAQDSGEDWDQVSLAMSTATLQHEVALPELGALYLGKSQPPKPSGYRPSPPGLGKLFESYDRAKRAPVNQINSSSIQPTGALSASAPSFERASSVGGGGDYLEDHFEDSDDGMYQEIDMAPEPSMMMDEFAAMEQEAPVPKMSAAPMPAPVGGFGGAPPMKAKKMAARGGRKRAPGAPPAAARPQQQQQPVGIEPEEQWLQFDKLRLMGPEHHNRGGLALEAQGARPHSNFLYNRHTLTDNLGLIDVSIGNHTPYDHRYQATGTFDVPSDANLHRVHLHELEDTPKMWWRTVPSQEESVYRLCSIKNTASTPLLNGPLDLYSGGKFLRQTKVESLDQGGVLELSLGVDDRIRAARNTKAHEEQKGLLGGKTNVLNQISIELTSNLGFPTRVEVIDRIPITGDEDDLEVQVHDASPAPANYKPSYNPLLKGAKKWTLDLAPGSTQTIQFSYTLIFSSKEEIIGGNRRG